MGLEAETPRTVLFGPYRLDTARRVLLRPEGTIALRPKTLEVLLLLLRHAGEVVSKEEILTTVWEGLAVSEYVLTTCISELRTALGETPKQPHFLKTVHRTGYQLLADVRHLDEVIALPNATARSSPVVGRDQELARLHAALQQARAGRRQIVFLTGEMGIGKTTLADEFLRPLTLDATQTFAGDDPDRLPSVVARGQCIEQYGAGEPYMPIFEAIGRLGRERDDAFVADTLRRHAPTWLVQIPGLLPPDERAALRRELPAETQEHMLRLIADGIEALSQSYVLVLLLEDLHASDPATLELLAALALRRGTAHLLILGTFRSGEEFDRSAAFASLKQQLALHRQCEEITLSPLTCDAVSAYLTDRFDGFTVPPGLGATLHACTEGNPLFLTRLVDQLLEDGVLLRDHDSGALELRTTDVGQHVPPNLRALIEQRADALSEAERQVLEVGSVAGLAFSAATVAAALEQSIEDVETLCAQLVRRHGFLVPGTLDDPLHPESGGSYRFSHALCQQVLYERVEPSRRQRLHAAIGRALVAAWGNRAAEIAAALATHFERGADPARAVEFYDKAAVGAAARGSNREAIGYFDHALALLARSADTPQRNERRLGLLMGRGPSVLAASGYGSVAVLENYRQALTLAQALENPMGQISCLLALSICHQTRAELDEGERYALELIRVAQALCLPEPLVAQLRNPLSQVRMHRGDLRESLALSEAAVAGSAIMPLPPTPPDSRPAIWADPRILLHCQHAAVAVGCGRLHLAAESIERSLALAHELHHPFNLAYADSYASLFEGTMGRLDRAIDLAREAIEITQTYEIPFWEGVAQIFHGHALTFAGDPRQGRSLVRQGIERWRGTGARLATTMHFNMLAEVELACDDVGAARAALATAEAHALATGEVAFLGENRRLLAECLRRDDAPKTEVEALLDTAIDLAREQGGKLWELRAATALVRLRHTKKARQQLATICAEFDDEIASVDVVQARRLLG